MTQSEELAQAPPSAQATLSRAFSGSASPRGAIKAFCLQCVGFVRADVKNCTARACALHAYRPFQGDSDPPQLPESTERREESTA
jgi:hypothetical protein